MEKMNSGHRGAYSSKQEYQKFLKAWERSGFLKSFRCDQNFVQILDSKSAREKLNQRFETPADRAARLARAKVELRYKMANL